MLHNIIELVASLMIVSHYLVQHLLNYYYNKQSLFFNNDNIKDSFFYYNFILQGILKLKLNKMIIEVKLFKCAATNNI